MKDFFINLKYNYNIENNYAKVAIIVILIAIVYMLPAIIAYFKASNNRKKWFVLNFTLGWTIVVWIISLIKILKEPNLAIRYVAKNNTEKQPITNICKNCGNELKGNESFCSKCGTKIDSDISKKKSIVNTTEQKINTKEPIIIQFTHLVIGIIILLLLVGIIVFIISLKSKSNNILSNSELTKILKVSEYGIYLEDTTVKVGASSSINYNNYDYLITYSCIFDNNGITLKAGGAILYNTKNKTNQILTFPADLTGIIYYLNTEEIDENLKSVTDIIAEYTEKYGTQQLFNNTSEAYVKMGKAIGQNVGVKLCRNVAKSYMTEMNTDMANCVFLYNKDEIFLKYIGVNTTVQVYNWQGIIDETGARLMAANNYSAYRNAVAIYGEPYINKTKFVVYEFVNDTTKEVNKYDSLQKAKEALNVEE